MAKKSIGYTALETRIQELEEYITKLQTEQQQVAKEATLPYKENLLEYVQMLRVSQAAAGTSIPMYVIEAMNELMDKTSVLLNKTEE